MKVWVGMIQSGRCTNHTMWGEPSKALSRKSTFSKKNKPNSSKSQRRKTCQKKICSPLFESSPTLLSSKVCLGRTEHYLQLLLRRCRRNLPKLNSSKWWCQGSILQICQLWVMPRCWSNSKRGSRINLRLDCCVFSSFAILFLIKSSNSCCLWLRRIVETLFWKWKESRRIRTDSEFWNVLLQWWMNEKRLTSRGEVSRLTN